MLDFIDKWSTESLDKTLEPNRPISLGNGPSATRPNSHRHQDYNKKAPLIALQLR